MRYLPWLPWLLLPFVLVFRVNLSPSEPIGLYRVSFEPLTRGAYVILKSPIKRIAGAPGDTVRATPEGSYVNGKLWPLSAIPGDSTYPHYPFGVYTLQPGQLWILGSHPDSYDSRFFGPVTQTLVHSTAEPLWTK
jgi:type IV secretory pathway protease TraF